MCIMYHWLYMITAELNKECMMKYDWALVPDSIKWIAMDDDGVANGYFDEPCAG